MSSTFAWIVIALFIICLVAGVMVFWSKPSSNEDDDKSYDPHDGGSER